MKVIKSDSGFLIFQKIFKLIHSNQYPVVLWQNRDDGTKVIINSILNSFNLESAQLHFEKKSTSEVRDGDIYFYCEHEQFIFKTSVQEIKAGVFTVVVPFEIKLLEGPDIELIRGQVGVDLMAPWKTKSLKLDDDYLKIKSMSERSTRDQEFLNNEFDSVSLDEEEKLFADKRESPRARPKIDKWVKVKAESSDVVHLLRLFDLSRGGIGFLSTDTHLFSKGSTVEVVGFEEFDLDDPLIGVVMSHRPIDEAQVEFKIGVKFSEGQE